MRWRTRLLILGLAGIGGFLLSRPEVRKYILENFEGSRSSLQKALVEGREEAAKIRDELNKIVDSENKGNISRKPRK